MRSHACDFIRMKGYSLVAALEAARNDQEHRPHYWVRKLALVGNQSGSSSSSVKGSPAVVKSVQNAFPAQGQSRELKTLGSKFDKLVQELRRGRPDAAPKAIMDQPRDRSRTPKSSQKKKRKRQFQRSEKVGSILLLQTCEPGSRSKVSSCPSTMARKCAGNFKT